MTRTMRRILLYMRDQLERSDCTITTAPRGTVYFANASEIVITHTATGETVKLAELTPETLREALK